MGYRERRLARADRLRDWASTRRQKSRAAFKAVDRICDGIPMGQPILVGHHSERHARRDQERIHNGMSKGIEHQHMAESMSSRADEIERQAENAIYSDDSDATERLAEKIAGLEAQRARINAINKIVRMKKLTEDERVAKLVADCGVAEAVARLYFTPDFCGRIGIPSYEVQNLGGNITRLRNRLEQLGGVAPAERPVVESGETATARAGLVVAAGMTTPRRARKQPRPVWTVSGNVAFWRPMLERLGGSWYHGTCSFWEDPAGELEAALQDEEREAQERKSVEPGPIEAETEAVD